MKKSISIYPGHICLILSLVLFIIIVKAGQLSITTQNSLYAAQIEIEAIQKQINALSAEIQIIQNNNLQYERIQDAADVSMIDDEDVSVSRGLSRLGPVIMRVTAYDLSYASCKKYPNHPEYGITASGQKVKEWHTIAAGPDIPFGTRIYIPYFKDKPNKGIFVVQDRGSAIKNGCLDVYMVDNAECMEFGVQNLEVFILDEVKR